MLGAAQPDVLLLCMQVFCIQFYLGTTRLQLEHKGDAQHHYTNFANIIVSFGFVVIPVIGWLLDHKGYGITLGTINCIGVIVSVLQAIPSLRLQVRLPYKVPLPLPNPRAPLHFFPLLSLLSVVREGAAWPQSLCAFRRSAPSTAH